jgi:hypothetical protein
MARKKNVQSKKREGEVQKKELQYSVYNSRAKKLKTIHGRAIELPDYVRMQTFLFFF